MFDGDSPDKLARNFCIENKITNQNKQFKLLQMIEVRMKEHYEQKKREIEESNSRVPLPSPSVVSKKSDSTSQRS